MRKYLLLPVVVFSSLLTFAQSSDADLNRRIDEYMRLTRELKFEALMDYTHPKIFAIAPKEQLVEVFKQSFDNESMKIDFDNTGIHNVSDDFKVKEVSYRKIDYWMSIHVTFKDTAALNDEGFITNMTSAFSTAFGGTVNFNKTAKKFEIKASSIMIAIKDSTFTEWMFLGYQKNEVLLKQLYPQEVIEHFKLL